MEDRSCRRCSVTRVNNLCKAYEKAHQNGNSSSMLELKEVAALVKTAVTRRFLDYYNLA